MSEPSTQTDAAPLTGTLPGEYAIDRPLGGSVSLAHHQAFDRPVALKQLPQVYAAHPEILRRFREDSQALVNSRSDHVATVLDIGAALDGRPFVVRDYIEGLDMAALVAARGPLPTAVACDLALQILEGLSRAHAAGLVHRNLKPTNLFLAPQPDGTEQVRICDFACPEPAERARIEATQEAKDALAWAAPEQQGGAATSASADLWSTAAVLFLLLTGRGPRNGEAITPLSELLPDVPPALDKVVSRCLALDPEKRFSSAAQMAQALAPFAARSAEKAGAQATVLQPKGAAEPTLGEKTVLKDTDAPSASLMGQETVLKDVSAMPPASGVPGQETVIKESPLAPPHPALTKDAPRSMTGFKVALALGVAALIALVAVVALGPGEPPPAPRKPVAAAPAAPAEPPPAPEVAVPTPAPEPAPKPAPAPEPVAAPAPEPVAAPAPKPAPRPAATPKKVARPPAAKPAKPAKPPADDLDILNSRH